MNVFQKLSDVKILFLFLFTILTLLAGGKMVLSDEVAFFLVTESIVERGDLAIPADIVNNGSVGKGGRFYVGGGLGQPLISIPLYLIGKWTSALLSLQPPYDSLVIKSVTTLENQILTALIGCTMFAFGLRLGYSRQITILIVIACVFGSSILVYSKTFIRDTQLTLYLLAGIYFLFRYKQTSETKCLIYSGAMAMFGLITKITFAIYVPFFYLYLFLILYEKSSLTFSEGWRYIATSKVTLGALAKWSIPLLLGIFLMGLENFICFDSFFSFGYFQRPGHAFSNPVWVGIYGMFFSSGKSFFLYVPASVLVFNAFRPFLRKFRAETIVFSLIIAVNVIFFARYSAWDAGLTWGNRYLLPLIPLFLLPIGMVLTSRSLRLFFAALTIIGCIVQFGGSAIYFGNYARTIGEYPYTRTYDDAEVIYRTRYIPIYSPVIGHWRILIENIKYHCDHERIELKLNDVRSRIPIEESEFGSALKTIDFWFMYAYYLRWPTPLIIFIILLFVTISLFFGRLLYLRRGAD